MKMRRSIGICLVLATVAATAGDTYPPTYPSEIVAALRPNIPAGWTVRSDARAIVISRDEQIILLNPINLPLMELKDILRDFGQKTDYLIMLVFKERMADKQYADLKAKRAEAIKEITNNPKLDGKTKYGMLNDEDDRHPLPTYFNSRFSIYLHRTDPPPLEVHPESAANQRTQVLLALSKMMTEYDHNNGLVRTGGPRTARQSAQP